MKFMLNNKVIRWFFLGICFFGALVLLFYKHGGDNFRSFDPRYSLADGSITVYSEQSDLNPNNLKITIQNHTKVDRAVLVVALKKNDNDTNSLLPETKWSDEVASKLAVNISSESEMIYQMSSESNKKLLEDNLTFFHDSLGKFGMPELPNNEIILPIGKGRLFVMIQSGDCPGSTHLTEQDKFAVDIGADEGTPILAAMDGVVMEVVDHFTEASSDPSYMSKANYIEIFHPVGYLTAYVHNKHRSAKVKVGETVKKGQVIAGIGNTGYTNAGPGKEVDTFHLHFELQKFGPEWQGNFRGLWRVVEPTFIFENNIPLKLDCYTWFRIKDNKLISPFKKVKEKQNLKCSQEIYRSKRGDSLNKIAKKFKIKINKLKEMNPKIKFLRPNMDLRVCE